MPEPSKPAASQADQDQQKASIARLDRITRAAQRLCAAPAAFIALFDGADLRLLSRQGTLEDAARWLPFARHIDDGGLLVVADAAADPRFAGTPVRLFAAWLLHDAGGRRIGMLAVAGDTPRALEADAVDALRDLAGWAESELGNTALRQELAAARESESRVHAVLDTVADGIIALDEYGRITSLNPAAVRIFGYVPEEVLGQNVAVLMPAAYHRAHDGYLKNFRDTGKTTVIGVDREVTARRKDGSLFAMELTVNEMWRNGTRGFAGIVRDVGARHESERRLREKSALLQAVMSSTSSFVYVRDTEGRYLYVNREYEQVFGLAPGAAAGKRIEDVFRPGLARHTRAMDNAVLNGGPDARSEDEVRLDDGDRIFLVVRSPLQDQHGRVYGVCGVGTDITLRKQAEEAMQSLNRQLAQTTGFQRAILNSANFSIISTDTRGLIRLFNVGAQRMLGYSPDEVVGRARPDIMHDPEELAARAKLLGIERGRRISPGFQVLIERAEDGADEQEWTYIRKDGSRLHVMLSVTAIRDERQQITGYLGVAYDLTERKKAEQLKNEFISTVSHELRTPLTSIRGSLGLLTAGVSGEIPAPAKSLLEIANNNCERLVRLINDILDIDKIESGHMRFDLTQQRMLPLVEQALAATRDYALQYRVNFELSADAAEMRVAVDGDRIVQVIVNLLSNAAKFSAPGDTVRVRLAQLPGCVRVSVIDRGEGIAESFRERVFQKFAQADSSDTRQKGGTGLGLSISRAIIDRHHGRIDFSSAPDTGTEFYFELPLLAHAVRVNDAVAQQGRVLICEDDPDIARLLGLMLMQAGLSSDVAYDAEQARRRLASGAYDALTLDLALPREDGLSLLHWIRARDETRDLPVVVVSARAEEGRQALTGGAIGIVDWIPKPIDETRLRGALQDALRSCKDDVPRVLHVEDDHDLVQVVAALLEPTYAVRHAGSLDEARKRLSGECFNLILLDLLLPDGHGSELLASLPPLNAATPIVVFSVEDATQPMLASVQAALVKSRTSNDQLLTILHDLIRQSRPLEERKLP